MAHIVCMTADGFRISLMILQDFHDGVGIQLIPFLCQELFQLPAPVDGWVEGPVAGRINSEAVPGPDYALGGEDFVFASWITFKVQRFSFPAGQQHVGGYGPKTIPLDSTGLFEGLGFPDAFPDDRARYGNACMIHMER